MIKIHDEKQRRIHLRFIMSFSSHIIKIQKKLYSVLPKDMKISSFYTGFIQQNIFSPWRFDVRPVGNRNNVLKLYSFFDWDQFSKKQIAFFIDRDLSMFLGESPRMKQIFTFQMIILLKIVL